MEPTEIKAAPAELIPNLLAILGPTGVGKSAAAVEVAERLGGEIIGCDALQVYRGLEAATAKPTAEQRARVRHHLVDCAEPTEPFSVGRYVRLAEQAIAGARGRGALPIVAGGTGLYFRALVRGLDERPGTDGVLRSRLRAIAVRRGVPFLHRWLARIDPESAARRSPRDVQRVIRDLEVAYAAGGPWSRRAATWHSGPDRLPTAKFALDLPREELAKRLDERVMGFFEHGLIEEVRGLLAAGVPETAGAFGAIGYREAVGVLRGELRFDEAVRTAQRRTRQLAKRQRTWIRSERGVHWLDVSNGVSAAARRICELWHEQMDAYRAGTGRAP